VLIHRHDEAHKIGDEGVMVTHSGHQELVIKDFRMTCSKIWAKSKGMAKPSIFELREDPPVGNCESFTVKILLYPVA